MSDWRNLANGNLIPSVNYCDQPYVVITNDHAWLCCITTSDAEEGAPGQHVATMRSLDHGKTWSRPVRVEPDDLRENSYAVMLKSPASGRIFIFYNHNTDNTREILSHNRKSTYRRVDCQGHFVFKYSDDNGLSWSPKRYDIPFRKFACDLENVYHGELCFFWNVGKAFTLDNDAYIPLIKVGKMGKGFYEQSEGSLLLSHNLLTEPDPEKITFETLPDGPVGLRTPPGGGTISEEQSYVPLSDDRSICATYRSCDGFPVECFSRDRGHTWKIPHYKAFSDGRLMKHPRAANFVWKCTNGLYLYWFHNHGGTAIQDLWNTPTGALNGHSPYDGRNPVWLCAGIEQDSPTGPVIRWSEPEIVLYDDNPKTRISYPDLIEDDGEYYLTETQKTIARSHHLSKTFLQTLWNSLRTPQTAQHPDAVLTASGPAPQPPDHTAAGGLSLRLTLAPDLPADTVLLDAISPEHCGFQLSCTSDRRLTLSLSSPDSTQSLSSPPLPLHTRTCTLIIDTAAHILSFVADGRFLDGGPQQEYGFAYLAPQTTVDNYSTHWLLAPSLQKLEVFFRPLLTCEA